MEIQPATYYHWYSDQHIGTVADGLAKYRL